jgi:hypothetical protein
MGMSYPLTSLFIYSVEVACITSPHMPLLPMYLAVTRGLASSALASYAPGDNAHTFAFVKITSAALVMSLAITPI